ncbi:MAPEG family protein [Myxococcota bacterium]|nr:MAPEG family protein [Myxococcota bacterium]
MELENPMNVVSIVALLSLVEYFYFSMQVGMARGAHDVKAPAVSGHPIFERHFRVQQNSLEQLIIFLPALWLFGAYVSPNWAALIGLVFIVGRFIYARGYVADPEKRTVGFAIAFLAQLALLFGALIGAVLSWW